MEDGECSVCLERFRDPRILPCGHFFCTDCLDTMLRSNNLRDCPQCRSPVNCKDVLSLPKKENEEKLENISPNFVLGSSVLMHSAFCDACNTQIVDKRYKCDQCDDFDLCFTCYKMGIPSENDEHKEWHTLSVNNNNCIPLPSPFLSIIAEKEKQVTEEILTLIARLESANSDLLEVKKVKLLYTNKVLQSLSNNQSFQHLEEVLPCFGDNYKEILEVLNYN